MRFLPVVTACFLPSLASAAVQSLKLVYPEKSELKKPVAVEFSIEGGDLKAHFEVRTPKIFAKPKLAPGEYPYQGDVVEVFVSVAGSAKGQPLSPFPYYEFELSPYDQTFEVRILSFKQPFQSGLHVGTSHSVTRTNDGWSADLVIPLNVLGWDGNPEHVIGNAYAILGQKPNRSYWAISLPPEKAPNFHKPEFFKPLALTAPK